MALKKYDKPVPELLSCFFSRVNEAMAKILIMQVYFKIYHAYNVYIMNGDKHWGNNSSTTQEVNYPIYFQGICPS